MTIRLAGCLAHIQRIYFIEKQTRWSKASPACRELIRRARPAPSPLNFNA